MKVRGVRLALTNNGGPRRKPNFEVVIPRSAVPFTPSSANIEESHRLGGFLVTMLTARPSGRKGFHKVYWYPKDYSVHTACLGNDRSMLIDVSLFPRTEVTVERVGPATFFVPFSLVRSLGDAVRD